MMGIAVWVQYGQGSLGGGSQLVGGRVHRSAQ